MAKAELEKKLAAFRENWNHARHAENERLYFAMIYGALIGGSLAISGNTDPVSINGLLVFILYVIGLFGFTLTVKLTFEFQNHVRMNQKIMNSEKDLKEYMGMPLDEGIYKFIKVRYVFLAFYIVVTAVWVALLTKIGLSSSENVIVSIIAGFMIAIQTISMILIIKRAKKRFDLINKPP